MRSWWYLLIVFCLLLCSCKSKNLSKSVGLEERYVSELAYLNEKIQIDTTKTAHSEQLSEKKRVVETLIITEYDQESGKPIKVTKATRETIQDTDKVVSEEGERRVYEVSNDSLNHFRDLTKMMESEVTDETEGGQKSFGKWFGIVVGCVIGFLFVHLLKFFRVN